MTATKYVYPISNGTKNGVIATDALSAEITASTIATALDYVVTVGDAVEIWFKAAISGIDQTTLTLIVSMHEGEPLKPEPTEVVVREEIYKTQSQYRAKGLNLNITALQGEKNWVDLSFPYHCNIFSCQYIHKDYMEGDVIDVIIAPDTLIGAITANVDIGDTVINVQPTVIDNLKIGYRVNLFTGVTSEEIGECIAIDSVNNQITVSKAATMPYMAGGPTYVRMNYYMVEDLALRDKHAMELGKDLIGGSLLPANRVLRLIYTNNEGTTVNKMFSLVLEIKF